MNRLIQESDPSLVLVDALRSFNATPGAIVERITEASKSFGESIDDFAIYALSVTFAIRFIYTVYKELSDSDFIEMVTSLFGLLLMGFILVTLITNWGNGSILSAPDLFDDLMGRFIASIDPSGAAASAGGQGSGAAIAAIFDSIFEGMLELWGVVLDIILAAIKKMSDIEIISIPSFAAAVKGIVAASTSAGPFFKLAAFSLLIVTALICIIAIAILSLVLTYHALSGFIAVQVVFAFGPVALAGWPLVDQWGKKAFSAAVAGAMQMVAAVFILNLVKAILPLEQMARELKFT